MCINVEGGCDDFSEIVLKLDDEKISKLVSPKLEAYIKEGAPEALCELSTVQLIKYYSENCKDIINYYYNKSRR